MRKTSRRRQPAGRSWSSHVISNYWQKGYTLVEVVMAMTILGIGIMSLIGLQVSNMSRNNSSRFHSDAQTLVMDQLEYLVSLPFNDDALEPQGNPAVANDGKRANRGPYTVEWDVEDNSTVIANSKKVHVAVSLNNSIVARGKMTRIYNGL